VSWIPLSYTEARGLITHYTVSYVSLTSRVKKRQAVGIMTKVVPGMDTGTTTLENLDPMAAYSIQVSASNGAGVSELSPAVVAQMFREGMYIYIYG
jgi:hypothetical protein